MVFFSFVSFDWIAQIEVCQCLATLIALSVAIVRSSNGQADGQFGQESKCAIVCVVWSSRAYTHFGDFLCIGQLGYVIDLTTSKLATPSDGLGVSTFWEWHSLLKVGYFSTIATPGSDLDHRWKLWLISRNCGDFLDELGGNYNHRVDAAELFIGWFSG